MEKTFDLAMTILKTDEDPVETVVKNSQGVESARYFTTPNNIVAFGVFAEEQQPVLSDKDATDNYKFLTLDTNDNRALYFNENAAREFIDTLNEYFQFETDTSQ